jgi:hypothetical protein
MPTTNLGRRRGPNAAARSNCSLPAETAGSADIKKPRLSRGFK